LQQEQEEKERRKQQETSYGECLKNQATMDKAKRLVEEEQRRALLTNDPKERQEIIKRLREKIKQIVKCKNCQRIISQRIIEV